MDDIFTDIVASSPRAARPEFPAVAVGGATAVAMVVAMVAARTEVD
jgi:hypothetical protein